jgi:uncharacterized GH25 family protein
MNQCFKCVRNLLAVAIVFSLANSASAHRSWLLPSSTQLEGKDTWVTVDAAISESVFEADSNALKLDTLAIVNPKGEQIKPENTNAGKLRSVFDVNLTVPGTYKISLVNQNVMVSYQLNGETKRWRGSEKEFANALGNIISKEATALSVTKHYGRIETFVSHGKPSREALKISGIGLEILPLDAATEFQVGQAMNFQMVSLWKIIPLCL